MTEHPEALLDFNRRLATENLKVCPLCGAVNALQNGECFVCRWHGEFSHDPISVEMGLAELLERCPELRTSFMLEQAPQRKPLQRMLDWVDRMLGRNRLDVRI